MIRGRIIAESLRVGADLRLPELTLVRLGRHDVATSTRPSDERDDGRDEHGVVSGQPTTWTFIDFEAPGAVAEELAGALADLVDDQYGWWADFTVNDAEHVIVFAGRSFRYRIGDRAGRAEAVAWGLAQGTPEHQLDWGP